MSIYSVVAGCRACGATDLLNVLSLGEQALTGVFPETAEELVPSGPLDLAWCRECHLVQLSVNYDEQEMYGDNYGYRSGLNSSMVDHLGNVANRLKPLLGTRTLPTVLDIGSNDGTFLRNFNATNQFQTIGMDPTASKFLQHYSSETAVISNFFTADAYKQQTDRSADLVTTISMFYDLPEPVEFARQVREIISEDGFWYLEQSYMPSMLRTTSYDTVCHEHLEYYSLDSASWILRQAGFRIADVRFNRINGGSFGLIAVPQSSRYVGEPELVKWFTEQESRMGFSTPRPFREFESRVYQHREDLLTLLRSIVAAGKTVGALGASTKGNVLLQFCGLDTSVISAIGDPNEYKDGRFTPGTAIPIVSEQEIRRRNFDYLLVLPWHFREGIVERERDFLNRGGGLIFPLPEIEIVGG